MRIDRLWHVGRSQTEDWKSPARRKIARCAKGGAMSFCRACFSFFGTHPLNVSEAAVVEVSDGWAAERRRKIYMVWHRPGNIRCSRPRRGRRCIGPRPSQPRALGGGSEHGIKTHGCHRVRRKSGAVPPRRAISKLPRPSGWHGGSQIERPLALAVGDPIASYYRYRNLRGRFAFVPFVGSFSHALCNFRYSALPFGVNREL